MWDWKKRLSWLCQRRIKIYPFKPISPKNLLAFMFLNIYFEDTLNHVVWGCDASTFWLSLDLSVTHMFMLSMSCLPPFTSLLFYTLEVWQVFQKAHSCEVMYIVDCTPIQNIYEYSTGVPQRNNLHFDFVLLPKMYRNSYIWKMFNFIIFKWIKHN